MEDGAHVLEIMDVVPYDYYQPVSVRCIFGDTQTQRVNVYFLKIITVSHFWRRVALKRLLIHDGAERGQFSAHRNRGSQVRWHSVQISLSTDNLQT